MKKKLLKGLLFLLTGLLAIAFLCYENNGKFSVMPKEKSMKAYPTIKDLLLSGSVKNDTWYWVDDRPGSIHVDVASPSIPLLEGKKSYVVTPEYYLQGDYGESVAWQAFMFRKIQSTEGEKYILTRRVYISHWGKITKPDDQLEKSMDMDNLPPGFHAFKSDAQNNIVPISINDVAFLRSYHRVKVTVAEDGTRTTRYQNIRPLVAKYVLYDYHPSGRMKRRLAIAEDGVLAAHTPGKTFIDRTGDDRDKYLEYEVRDRKFNDKGQPQTKPSEEVITRLKDRDSPYWLQNILHD